MNELKKTDEIVRALRICNNPKGHRCSECPVFSCYKHGVCKATVDRAAADLIDSLTAQITDYHHMEQLVDGKMAENQRLRKINENLQSQLTESQRREQAAVELIRKIYDTTDDNFCDSCRKIVRMIEIWWGDDEKGAADGN